MTRFLPLVLLLASSVVGACSASAAQSPEAVVAGFDERVDAMFRTESGQPLVREEKKEPLGPGRGNYVRGYSYSMVGFAARCLYLGEKLDEANAALAENAQHYLDHPDDINDRDSFHWHADGVMRLVEMYGSQGTRHPGRITKKTINGHPVNYAPRKVFESPFLNADWNSGVVTITKGDRKKVLNFENGNSAQGESQR